MKGHSGAPAATALNGGLETQLHDLRAKALQGLLVVSAVVASVAWFPGVYAAWTSDLMVVVVLDTAMWIAVIVLALWRSLGYAVRAAAFCTVWLLFSSALLWILGPVGAGVAWLLALPVLTTLFYGARGAAAGVGAILVVGLTGAIALASAANGVGAIAAIGGPAYTMEAWLASLGSVAFLAVILALSVHLLLRGLERSLAAERRANDALRETLAERARLEAAAIEGAKAKALGTLAGGIAHDLNNLLVPLLVAGDEARSAAEPGSLQRRRLDIVLASAERARVLAGRVLAFMRSAPEERRPIALAPLVREVAGLLRSGSPVSTAVEVTIAADAVDVRVDALADELHRVLMNLGSNALRAVAERPTGGTVAFELTTRRADTGEAVVRVRDDGPGVPDHVRARLFEPYVTSRPTGGGTGLGLAIVSHVVAGLGGRVSLLESGAGGSTFEVVLPASSRVDPVRVTPAPATDGPAPSGPPDAPAVVLVVDDEPLVRATTSMALEALGYAVVEVGSADAALAHVHDAPASVDVVVSDVAMPHMAGLDLVRALRAVRPDLPVVLMSGRVDDALTSEVEAEGVRWLLAKPFDRTALASAVAEAVGAAAR